MVPLTEQQQYMERKSKMPQIKAGEVDAYQKSQNFSVKLDNIGHPQSWNVLDTPDIICMLLLKLPGTARDKSINVLTISKRRKRELDLTDSIRFANNQTLVVRGLIFSKDAVDQYMDKKPNNRRTTVSSFASKNDGKVHVEDK